MRPISRTAVGLVLFAAVIVTVLPAAASPCESLTSLIIPNTTVTAATASPAGAPASPGYPPSNRTLPAFCRVLVTSKPVDDSEIHLELWLPPAESWNGKFEGTGNGGFSSAIGYRAMEQALADGYATAGSDTGHEGGDLKFGVGHPEKINDWAYRAVHVMTETSKLIVRDYYGRFAQYAYFNGCSTGGHQALTEAQRFPADYDGIVAGDPANNRIHLIAGFLYSWLALYKDPASPLPASKLPLINKAAIAVCDGLDGVKDGVIDDPRLCHFDPGTLLCKGADDATCLTAPQVAAVRKIYDGARNPRTGEQIFTGWPRGSEASGGGSQIGGWTGYIVGQPEPARTEFFRLWVFNDPNWDLRTFDFDRDLAFADAKMAVVNSNVANLAPFKAHGGKLVMYHGWADPVVPPQDGVHYYEAVEKAMGGAEKTKDFFRLFMAPGMAHCAGGPGPNTFDAVTALDKWVTAGAAPEKIIASHSTNGAVDRTRPLCPYPQVARWKGTGSTDDAANFSCVSPAAKPAHAD
jgi:tannase/feruloyl esterase